MKSTFGSILVVVLFCSLMAAPAHAGLVTVSVTGQVTSVSEYGGGSNFPAIGVGSSVTGYYRYDDATPDWNYHTNYGQYDALAFSLTFEDGSTISVTDGLHISVIDGVADSHGVNLPWGQPSTPSPLTLTEAFAGLSVRDGSRIYLRDTNGDAWDSDALPDPESLLSLLTVNDESTLFFGMLTSDGVEIHPYGNIKFEITDLSVVPVPGALALAILGLSSAGPLLRRRNGPA